jgi:hypothetical protein
MSSCHGWHSFFILILFLFQFAQARAEDFCSRGANSITQAFLEPSNRMGFKNHGGIANGGVCWWHSRLQRSSVYLARFAPDKPKPSDEEALLIIQSLINFSQVVEIPGYPDFNAFSEHYEALIQKELNAWQIRDGFISQQWIRGISGVSRLPDFLMKMRMDRVYDQFRSSRPGMWLMVQIRGVTSHALLLLSMEPTKDGYDLSVIDSNRPSETRELQYRFGDENLYLGNTPFVPYPGFFRDQERIDDALRKYCGT